MTKTMVGDWMTRKVVTVKPRDTVAHAREIMEDKRLNQLPVCVSGAVVGILTDRDVRDATPSFAEYAEEGRQLAPRHDPAKMFVEHIMTPEPLTAGPGDDISEIARMMRKQRIGSLPVVEEGRLVGILTRSDLLDALVELGVGGND